MTTTFLSLKQRLSEAIGDITEFDTTTDIVADNSVISTDLNEYDQARDDFFGNATNGRWLYITEGENAGVQRKVYDYTTSGGVLTVRGAVLDAEAAAVTCWLGKYSMTNKALAIVRAIARLYPMLHRKLDNRTLVTGNSLANSHFEDWAATTAPDTWTLQDSNITVAQDTTAGEFRGGVSSMKATTGASGAGKYVYQSSVNYPRLLDVMNQTVHAYVWVYPQTADDATITIYTLQADGTAQTLASTTTCPAATWTLLKLENQALSDDLVKVEVRLGIATASQYVIFDNARLIGRNRQEYRLPLNFQSGTLQQVYIQDESYSDEAADDLHPRTWNGVEAEVVTDLTTRYLRLLRWPSYEDYQIRLIGDMPLEALSDDSDTISIDDNGVDLIVARAAQILYRMEASTVSAEDRKRYDQEIAKWVYEESRLVPSVVMTRNATRLHSE